MTDMWQMPEWKRDDGTVMIWDPSSHTYVEGPAGGGDLAVDRGHASGGDNDLFDPAGGNDGHGDGNLFQPSNPDNNGWLDGKTSASSPFGEFKEGDMIRNIWTGDIGQISEYDARTGEFWIDWNNEDYSPVGAKDIEHLNEQLPENADGPGDLTMPEHWSKTASMWDTSIWQMGDKIEVAPEPNSPQPSHRMTLAERQGNGNCDDDYLLPAQNLPDDQPGDLTFPEHWAKTANSGDSWWPNHPTPGSWAPGRYDEWNCPNCNTPVELDAHESAPWNKDIHNGISHYDWRCPNGECNPTVYPKWHQYHNDGQPTPAGTSGFYYPDERLVPRDSTSERIEDPSLKRGYRVLVHCSCGNDFETWNSWANECERCGREYDSGGNLLAPRSQWGEETGEGHYDENMGFQSDYLDKAHDYDLKWDSSLDNPERQASIRTASEGFYVSRQDITTHEFLQAVASAGLTIDEGPDAKNTGVDDHFAVTDGKAWVWVYFINDICTGAETFGQNVGRADSVLEALAQILDADFLSEQSEEYWQLDEELNPEFYDELASEGEHLDGDIVDPDIPDAPPEHWGKTASPAIASAESFHDQVRAEAEQWDAMARDVAATLPPEEWPHWVRNRMKDIMGTTPLQWWQLADQSPSDLTFPPEWGKTASPAVMEPTGTDIAMMPDINYVLDHNPEDRTAPSWEAYRWHDAIRFGLECLGQTKDEYPDSFDHRGTWDECWKWLANEAQKISKHGGITAEVMQAIMDAAPDQELVVPYSAGHGTRFSEHFKDEGVFGIRQLEGRTSRVAMPYHVSPRKNREKIEQEGLHTFDKSHAGNPQDPDGIYYWDKPEQARDFGDRYLRDEEQKMPPYDLWHFDLNEFDHPEPDAFFDGIDPVNNDDDAAEFGPYYNEDGTPGAHYLPGGYIEPDRLKRVSMAERTGDPELDKLIEEFAQTMGAEKLRDPGRSSGECIYYSEEFAAFLKTRGVDAKIIVIPRDEEYGRTNTLYQDPNYSDKEWAEMGIVWNQAPPGATLDDLGYQGGGFEDHHAVQVNMNGHTYVVDWTATQYGGQNEVPQIFRSDSGNWDREW